MPENDTDADIILVALLNKNDLGQVLSSGYKVLDSEVRQSGRHPHKTNSLQTNFDEKEN